jgi:hypothetical protein
MRGGIRNDGGGAKIHVIGSLAPRLRHCQDNMRSINDIYSCGERSMRVYNIRRALRLTVSSSYRIIFEFKKMTGLGDSLGDTPTIGLYGPQHHALWYPEW